MAMTEVENRELERTSESGLKASMPRGGRMLGRSISRMSGLGARPLTPRANNQI